MEKINLILTILSIILGIISDIISIQAKKKVEKINENVEMKITCVTTEAKYIKTIDINQSNL